MKSVAPQSETEIFNKDAQDMQDKNKNGSVNYLLTRHNFWVHS